MVFSDRIEGAIIGGLLVIVVVALATLLGLQRRRTASTRAERDAAEETGRARTEFLAMVSHEMRTPLNGILGIAGELLTHDLGAPERNYVRVIQDSGHTLLHLINDVLDFARLDADRLELEETAFDMRALLGDAVELLETQARAKGLALTLHVEPDVPRRVGGDPQRLRQVLLNLIGNAIKFTHEGSVMVGARRVGGEAGRVRLEFCVRDTGIGIAPETMPMLFAAFRQAERNVARRFGGTGLGLAISQRLVERMGGSIRVQSKPGEGSAFRFDVLLLARRASDEGAAPRAPLRAAPAGLRVLVAEDNATNRLVATRMLERMGHVVACVADGRQALAAVRDGAYDLVLMDVMMPEMDGMEATRAIRLLPAPRGTIPVIGLTAAAAQADAAACLAAGMDYFARKPIDASALAQAVARVTESHRAAAEPTSAHGRAEGRVFDPAVLDALVGDIGAEASGEIVKMFVGGSSQQMTELRAMADQRRPREMARMAHSLGNTARSVGLMRVARAAGALEADGAGPERMDALQAMLHEGVEELRAWRPLKAA